MVEGSEHDIECGLVIAPCMPARKEELHGAIEEGIEIVYNTQPVGVTDGKSLRCVRTEMGEPDEDGRRRPVVVEGSEHDIECGLVIAAVGQKAECAELEENGLMDWDRVKADFEGMVTADPMIFAAGDGGFGGSTIVEPVGTDAPSYIGYVWEGENVKALEAINATNPFSAICGRVCDAPCEPACRRADSDGPCFYQQMRR